MKIYIRRLLWPVLLAGFLAANTAGYGQCYRVYLRMTADFSFYQRHGSNANTARQVMRNTLTADVLARYQALGVEFVLLPSVVHTNQNGDPFRNIPARNATLQTVQDIVSAGFAPTNGGGWSISPFNTPATPGFTYEINILFMYKTVVNQFGSFVNGSVLPGGIGSLYTNNADLWLSQANDVAVRDRHWKSLY